MTADASLHPARQTLARWHQLVESQDHGAIAELLREDCTFLSPVVHTPQRGREITHLYLTGAMQVLGKGFHYVKEIADEHHAVLEFECEVDGLTVNGVDIMSFDEQGKIYEFKVMVRPLKAIHAVHAQMGAMLEALKTG